MSVINVTVTNAGAANVAVSGGSTVNATVGNGGAVNVSLGTISPGSATVVSGTLAINSVTTLAAGTPAYVKNDLGTAYAAKLDIGIPAGPATSVTVAKTTTLTAGSSATVTGVTDGGSLALSFGIPVGAAGTNGTNGTNGITPTITASATTLSAGSSATVTATPSNGGADVALAFGIPSGAAGSSGPSLSDATPSALGTASAGTSSTASRSDHVHATPVISYANLSNVPSTFAPSTHTHTASQVTDFTTAAAAAAPVQAVAGRTGTVTLVAADVGLGSVDNTADTAKPISTATQTALDGKAATSHTHALSSLTQSGATTGQVAAWNGSAWAPATPSSGGGGGSANIFEAATAAGFPATGSAGTLYHATDVRRIFFWDATGGVYVEAGTSGGGFGSGITNAVSLTQSAYDALGSKSATTLYIISG
jgi:hypothetical protein